MLISPSQCRIVVGRWWRRWHGSAEWCGNLTVLVFWPYLLYWSILSKVFPLEVGDEEGAITMRAPPVKLFKLLAVNWVRIVCFFPFSKPSVTFGHIPRKLNYKRRLIFPCFLSLKAIKGQWNRETANLLKFPKGRASFRITLVIWEALAALGGCSFAISKNHRLDGALNPWKNTKGVKNESIFPANPIERAANIRNV